jgi:hypothetical protein
LRGVPLRAAGMEETRIYSLIEAVNRGDARAENDLLNHVYGRLQALTRRMFQGKDRLHRWEQTDDVLQNAMLRLHRAIDCTEILSPRHFINLATSQIRRELIDLGRKHYGPLGVGRNHHTSHTLFPKSQMTLPNGLSFMNVWEGFQTCSVKFSISSITKGCLRPMRQPFSTARSERFDVAGTRPNSVFVEI